MSNKEISYLQTLCNISDDYVECLDTLSSEELQEEHSAVFGNNSGERAALLKGRFNNIITNKKKELLGELAQEDDEVRIDNTVIESIKSRFGTLKNFLQNGFINNTDMPGDLTLQYRNMEEVTEEDIELLIEALHENGELNFEEDDS